MGGEFKNSKKKSKIQFLYLLTCFSYLFSIVWLLFACAFLSFFFYLFCVSYELGWCLVMILRMLGYCASIFFSLVKIWDTFAFI